MTFKLIFENLRHRPVRTLLSVLLIAIPVTLILTLVGLGRGMVEESKRRSEGIRADIMVRAPNSSALSFSSASMPQDLVKALANKPHVVLATGVIIQTVSGITNVFGVDLDEFNKMSGGFEYVEGGPFQQPDDILVDDFYAQQKKLHVGDTTEVLNHKWRVAGIYVTGKLARMVLPLPVVQDLTGNSRKVSVIYLKVDHKANIESVVDSLKKEFSGYPIMPMAEYLSLVSVENIPGLNSLIHVMVGIGIVIGFAVVCLSMYMAVLQRTREIGILKSLGASRVYILELIVAEAFMLGIGGTIVGILLSFGARWLILTLVPASLQQAIVPDWWPIAGLIALFASLLGAMYPGLHAARQDPIEALAYE
ncbi:MAG TPA: ABC transporter permease [Bryobacteraceae bacterium]|nr:ABC transporter permease [Bryobacteraceae bacterium]